MKMQGDNPTMLIVIPELIVSLPNKALAIYFKTISGRDKLKLKIKVPSPAVANAMLTVRAVICSARYRMH